MQAERDAAAVNNQSTSPENSSDIIIAVDFYRAAEIHLLAAFGCRIFDLQTAKLDLFFIVRRHELPYHDARLPWTFTKIHKFRYFNTDT